MFDFITDASRTNHILKENRSLYSAYAGYFGSYFPVELLYGFNIHPVRIMGYAQTHARQRDLMNYMCAYLTDVIYNFEADNFTWANYLILPATCDSLYGAQDYIEKNIINVKTKLFRLPLKFTQETYQAYKSSVENVLEWLSNDHVFDNALLRESIEMRNKLNKKIMKLLSCEGSTFKGALYLKLMIAKSVLPPPVFMSLLENINEKTLAQNHEKDRHNILLLGPMFDNMGLIDYINKDHNVVTKLMTSTLGLFDSEVSLEGDIKDNLIRNYFDKAGSATSYNYFFKLIKELDNEIEKYSIKGIIYFNYKFCEPHMFFSRQLISYWEKSGVKVLYLEQEHSEGMDPLIQNKIDIFMENL